MELLHLQLIIVPSNPYGMDSAQNNLYPQVVNKQCRIYDSLCVLLFVADLNRRMQDIMTLLNEDEHFSVKSEIYPEKGMQLFQMLDDFRDSYRSLAEMYDQLRSDAVTNLNLTSFSDSNKSKPFLRSVDSNVESDNANFDFEHLNTLVEELMSTKMNDMNINTRKNQCKEKTTDVPREDSFEGDSQSELNFQVSELMHENFHQVAELARRNIEKRVMINRLQVQLQNLTDENRALQSHMSREKVREKQNQFQIPKLKRLVSSKFFRHGS